MMGIQTRAPAKINVGLKVLGRREDGYHEIQTVMQMVSLFDDLEITPGPPGIAVEADHPDLPAAPDNLVHRAARLLARDAGLRPAVRIRLTKRIPVAAGLGGGSSDAAATLAALNRYWNLGRNPGELAELAARIGMDVPFFLFGPTAFATGRGERIQGLAPPQPPLWVLLVHPGFGISTKAAYESLKLGLTTENKHISIRKFPVARGEGTGLRNDLEKIVFRKDPVLEEIKNSLDKSGALAASMSGSGPTLFGLFAERHEAEAVAGALSGKKNLSVFMVRTLRSLPA